MCIDLILSFCRTDNNFDSANEGSDVGEDAIAADEMIDGVADEETTTQSRRKRRKPANATDADTQLAAVLARSLKTKAEKEESEQNDPDRLFLLSLLQDFHQIDSSKKNLVKIQILNAISAALHSPPSSAPESVVLQPSIPHTVPSQFNSIRSPVNSTHSGSTDSPHPSTSSTFNSPYPWSPPSANPLSPDQFSFSSLASSASSRGSYEYDSTNDSGNNTSITHL